MTGTAGRPLKGVVVSAEEMVVDSEWVRAESVVVRRRIVTETISVRVTVRREELEVERVRVSPAPVGPTLPEVAPLVVVLREQVPVVNVMTRPYEQVTISVERLTDHQTVSAHLDREQAQVTSEGPLSNPGMG